MRLVLWVVFLAQASAFLAPPRALGGRGTVTTRGAEKKLTKVEQIKVDSQYLREPLRTEMGNDEIFVTHDAYQILKYHGSYQQDNRDLRKKGQQKAYSFMLRLKSPGGEIPAALHQTLDDLCDEHGQHDLRVTTRQAYQMHGVL
jgi:sulfite reductase (ferredoxin)